MIIVPMAQYQMGDISQINTQSSRIVDQSFAAAGIKKNILFIRTKRKCQTMALPPSLALTTSATMDAAKDQ